MLGVCEGKGDCHQGCTFSLAQLTTTMCGLIMVHYFQGAFVVTVQTLCAHRAILFFVAPLSPANRVSHSNISISNPSYLSEQFLGWKLMVKFMMDGFEVPVTEANNRST
jgi:hypothetical protein